MEFEFNVAKARVTVTLLVLSSLLLVSILTFTSKKIQYSNVFVFSLYAIYAFFVIFLVYRFYASYKKAVWYISIYENILTVPTFHLGVKSIDIKKVYSIENQLVRGVVIAVILGIEGNGQYILDRERFKNEKDFDELSLHLKEMIGGQSVGEKKLVVDRLINRLSANKVWFSYIFFGICIFLYFLGTEGSFDYSDNYKFIAYGGNTKATLSAFEIYRIPSSNFLHLNFFHLMLNMLMLGLFSQMIEKALSNVRFANLMLLSGIISVLMSSKYSSFDASLGSSGALFGLWGGYTFLRFKFDKYLPGSIKAIPLFKFYAVLLLEVVLELFVIKNIDYLNHLGGFVTGFIYLSIVPLGAKLETIDQPIRIEKLLFFSLVIFYLGGLGYFLLRFYGLI